MVGSTYLQIHPEPNIQTPIQKQPRHNRRPSHLHPLGRLPSQVLLNRLFSVSEVRQICSLPISHDIHPEFTRQEPLHARSNRGVDEGLLDTVVGDVGDENVFTLQSCCEGGDGGVVDFDGIEGWMGFAADAGEDCDLEACFEQCVDDAGAEISCFFFLWALCWYQA